MTTAIQPETRTIIRPNEYHNDKSTGNGNDKSTANQNDNSTANDNENSTENENDNSTGNENIIELAMRTQIQPRMKTIHCSAKRPPVAPNVPP